MSTPPMLQDEKTQTNVATQNAPSRLKRILKMFAWTFLVIFLLLLFTLLKLPQDKVRGFIQGSISSALSSRGITLTADESDLSLGWGISYKMKGVTLAPPPPAPPSKIDEIRISPSIFSLLVAKPGGKILIRESGGTLEGSFSYRTNQIAVSFEAKEMDLGKIGVLAMAAGIQGSAVVTGTGTIQGDPGTPSSLTGDVALELKKIAIDAQRIQGFSIPRLSISTGQLNVRLENSKALVKTLRLGKPGNAEDDITGTASGEVTLGRQWESSMLNLTVQFGLSQKVLKSFGLIDALLGAGKQPDGTYSYQLTGPIVSPIPTPVKAK